MPANIDDPAHLNAFLKMIGGDPLPEKPLLALSETSPDFKVPINSPCSNFTAGAATMSPTRAESAGLLTILPSATATDNTLPQADSIPCDETSVWIKVAEKSNLGLEHSQFAPRGGQYRPMPSSLPGSNVLTPKRANVPATPRMTPTQTSLLNKIEASGKGKSYEDQVVAKFRSEHAGQVEPKGPSQSAAVSQTTDPFPKTNDMLASKEAVNGIGTRSTETSTRAPVNGIGSKRGDIQTFEEHSNNNDVFNGGENETEESTVKDFSASSDTTPIEPAPIASTVYEGSVKSTSNSIELKKAKEQLSAKVAGLGVRKPPTVAATQIKLEENTEEKRENITHFKSWGTPPPRIKQKSRVRRVILTKLPKTTDYTLVQSLIHGGAIETIKLLGPTAVTATATAYVTFADADAADAYATKYRYPNSVNFNFQGKRNAVFVDPGKDVDVISGLMQGYLDCGGSRVVMATGAEDDWTVRALHKLAEGKGRKVENILDSFRNEVRTIVFRFANIVDAVQFKGVLIRDPDWELCNIQFMPDPCEKATGIHLE